jgi:hypothetical protein
MVDQCWRAPTLTHCLRVGELGLFLFFVLGKRATCLYDHTLEEITGQYLPFKRGDTIYVLSEDPDGWWLGYTDEQQGLFPQEFVQIIEDTPVPVSRPPLSSARGGNTSNANAATTSYNTETTTASCASVSDPSTPRTNDDDDDDDDDDVNPLHEALAEVIVNLSLSLSLVSLSVSFLSLSRLSLSRNFAT